MRRLFLVAVGLLAQPALADDAGTPPPSPLTASLVCDQPAAAGRLRCDAEVRTRAGTLRWADVEVVGVPAFIAPLRGRTGPREATTTGDDLWRFSLGLVAKDRGEGDVAVRIRAVVCSGEVCTPWESVTQGHVKVGS